MSFSLCFHFRKWLIYCACRDLSYNNFTNEDTVCTNSNGNVYVLLPLSSSTGSVDVLIDVEIIKVPTKFNFIFSFLFAGTYLPAHLCSIIACKYWFYCLPKISTVLRAWMATDCIVCLNMDHNLTWNILSSYRESVSCLSSVSCPATSKFLLLTSNEHWLLLNKYLYCFCRKGVILITSRSLWMPKLHSLPKIFSFKLHCWSSTLFFLIVKSFFP